MHGREQRRVGAPGVAARRLDEHDVGTDGGEQRAGVGGRDGAREHDDAQVEVEGAHQTSTRRGTDGRVRPATERSPLASQCRVSIGSMTSSTPNTTPWWIALLRS